MKKYTFSIMIVLMAMTTAAAEQKETPFTYNDHGKRDPLWPLVTSTGGVMNYDAEVFVSDMVLEGIIVGSKGEGNLAIINGVIVKSKDLVGQYSVADITPSSVVLIKGQERFILKLKKED
ncbi:MAG: hypothetical protein A2787_06620 [Omnitrophica WOR_2 bacterium RIFCSPHIGHO2_01_FULL_48_9]|nr:MAG: hypothetical protein A3D10_05475 [Omnitrophica WOR_2 bacterium RIFCSPHIGHO2_02_FULL_48_11]OGX30451.1 MAG: hypothetical protein A2787_06620 [Omnitrophica WOR_2 bacterium RIFCSPHIGHO2_01_FULL_48_9]